MKSMTISIIFLIFGMALVGWLVYEEMAYKMENHCVNLGQPSVRPVPHYFPGTKGAFMVYFTNEVTFLYQCDNGQQRF